VHCCAVVSACLCIQYIQACCWSPRNTHARLVWDIYPPLSFICPSHELTRTPAGGRCPRCWQFLTYGVRYLNLFVCADLQMVQTCSFLPQRSNKLPAIPAMLRIYKLYFAKLAARYKKIQNTEYTKSTSYTQSIKNPMLVIGVSKRNKQRRVHQS